MWFDVNSLLRLYAHAQHTLYTQFNVLLKVDFLFPGIRLRGVAEKGRGEEEGAELGPRSQPQAKLRRIMFKYLRVTRRVLIALKRELNCWPISS